jgi:1,3-beta-glucan synthase
VIRFAILYFVMLFVFLGLIVGPVVVGKLNIVPSLDLLKNQNLLQPTLANNDTTDATTGTGKAGTGPARTGTPRAGAGSSGSSRSGSGSGSGNIFNPGAGR